MLGLCRFGNEACKIGYVRKAGYVSLGLPMLKGTTPGLLYTREGRNTVIPALSDSHLDQRNAWQK
jgi:hypothetical protein